MGQTLSIVIPTYNRGPQLVQVVDHILESNIRNTNYVEIIVIDNSSAIPAERFIDRRKIVEPFSLEVITQPNNGPGAARNIGLSRARGEIIVFIDDDVLIGKHTLEEHQAAHLQHPGAVIFGGYPYSIPQRETQEYRFLKGLLDEGMKPLAEKKTKENLVQVNAVASGNLSIEKKFFNSLYDTSLHTPVAEEYELNYSLFRKNIPIYTGIGVMQAWHLQPPTIKDKCKQEYKYGLGIAEVCIKRPEVLELDTVRWLFDANREVRGSDMLRAKTKKVIKNFLAIGFIRKALLGMIHLLSHIFTSDKILFPLYRVLAGIYLFAGIRKGMRSFKKHKEAQLTAITFNNEPQNSYRAR
ncbi:MAG: glycosyltransferase family A protein [Chitinophagaceae bacterium]